MSKIKDSLLGFAVGDALGVPVEFESREYLLKNPVTTMIGYGSADVPEGVWSDDTSMTLATMDSIIECKGINCNDMADKFCEWISSAKYTATDDVFDVGITTKFALLRYASDKSENKDATKCGGTYEQENGNGSLMRMMPIAFYCFKKKLAEEEIYEVVKKVSSITHAHEISIMGCFIYILYMLGLLNEKSKEESYESIRKIAYEKYFSEEAIKKYERIINMNIKELKMNDIKSSGFIVHTLEAVLWVVLNSKNFTEGIIGAVNLGEDTDTIGAITGSIVGILYDRESIP